MLYADYVKRGYFLKGWILLKQRMHKSNENSKTMIAPDMRGHPCNIFLTSPVKHVVGTQ